jgi:hypothetical protein
MIESQIFMNSNLTITENIIKLAASTNLELDNLFFFLNTS